MGEGIQVIQVTNIAPNASLEQMKTLFSFLGEVTDIVMYPDDENNTSNQSKVCYVKFSDSTCVPVSQHLTNTVFIDRALIIQPHKDNSIPDAETASSLTSGVAFTGGSNSGLISQIVPGVGGVQVISTIDPRLTALGLPQYPPLPANTDPSKVEEIRRTIYVGNLDSKITAEDVLQFFNQMGEVKYVRMAGDETQPTRFAFIEFTEQSSVANALQYNGVTFGGRPLKINHSNNAIVKPQPKTILVDPPLTAVTPKDIEEAMRRVREAQSQITAQIDPSTALKESTRDRYEGKRRDKSRSRSKSRRRSGSRDIRRSKSRDRTRIRRSRSRERSRRSPRRRRSYSRERRRSPRSRSRSKDRHSRRYRSPTPDRDRDRRRDRERRRSPDRRTERDYDRRDRSRERDARKTSRKKSKSLSQSPESKERSKHKLRPEKVVSPRDEPKKPPSETSSPSESSLKPEGPATPVDTSVKDHTSDTSVVEYKRRRSRSKDRREKRRSRSGEKTDHKESSGKRGRRSRSRERSKYSRKETRSFEDEDA